MQGLRRPDARTRPLMHRIVHRIADFAGLHVGIAGMASMVLTAGCAKTELDQLEPIDRKVLFIGIDGLDYHLVQELLERGQLPKLAELRRRGIDVPLYGERATTLDPYSVGLDPAESWSTIATGFSPVNAFDEGGGVHGVKNLTVTTSNGYDELPVTSQHRQTMTFWHVLGAAGVKCAVAGWWTTWPAEPLNGYLVSDRFFLEKFGLTAFGAAGRVDLPAMPASYRKGATPPKYLTWPEDLESSLAAELAPRVAQRPELIIPPLLQLQQRAKDAKDATTLASLKQVEQSLRTDFAVRDALIALLKRDPSVRFAACYLDSLDVASHLFWMHLNPQDWAQHQDPSIRAKARADAVEFANVIPMVALTIDAVVKDLVDAMGEDAIVVLATDHSLDRDLDATNRDFSLNRLFERVGLLVRDASGAIDWTKTTCFDRTTWQRNFIRTVSINFEGEWPQGWVKCSSPQERAARWREVQQKLFSIKIDRKWRKPLDIENPPDPRDPNDPRGVWKEDIFWDCTMGEFESHFIVYQTMPGTVNALLDGAKVSWNELFPPLPTSGRHVDPGTLLVSYPGEIGERYGKRGLPMGKSGAQARLVAPLVLALFGIPGSQRPDETASNSDFLYWMLAGDEAQRMVLMPRVESYESVVGFRDPTKPLGSKRLEQTRYVTDLGYKFE